MPRTTPTEPIWRLLAINLDPDQADPVLYALVLEGEVDQPLMLADRIVLFHNPARAELLLQEHGGTMKADKIDVSKPFFWCDIAQTLHLLQAGGDPMQRVERSFYVIIALFSFVCQF